MMSNWLVVHSSFQIKSGEEVFVEKWVQLLEKNNRKVYTCSLMPPKNLMGNILYYLFPVWSIIQCLRLIRLIREKNIHVVNIHNVYPRFGNSIILLKYFCTAKFVKTTHNYRDFCPTGLFFDGAEICTKCLDKNKIDILKNHCKNDRIKELLFYYRYLSENIWSFKWAYDFYLVLNPFQYKLYSDKVSDANAVLLSSNFIEEEAVEYRHEKDIDVIWVGRLNDGQKGFKHLLRFAKHNNERKIYACGNKVGIDLNKVPKNVVLTGLISKDALAKLYLRSKFLLITSLSYEVFPNTILEAWKYKVIPVVPDYPTLAGIVDSHGIIYSLADINELKLINVDIDFGKALQRYSARNILELIKTVE